MACSDEPSGGSGVGFGRGISQIPLENASSKQANRRHESGAYERVPGRAKHSRNSIGPGTKTMFVIIMSGIQKMVFVPLALSNLYSHCGIQETFYS